MTEVLRFHCPYCNKRYKTKPIRNPKTFDCKRCGETFELDVQGSGEAIRLVSKMLDDFGSVVASVDSDHDPYVSRIPVRPASQIPREPKSYGLLVYLLVPLLVTQCIAVIGIGWGIHFTNNQLSLGLQNIKRDLDSSGHPGNSIRDENTREDLRTEN